MDFVEYLSGKFILADPTVGCRRIGDVGEWRSLPESKTLFSSPPGCGLPIGNLTSQLFSNVYLNTLDQFAKRELHCRHYGRYVDDFYVVGSDPAWLESLVPQFTSFLERRLSLSVSREKTVITDVRDGVEFLGAYIKPGRVYVRNSTLARIRRKLSALEKWARGHDDGSIVRFREVALRLRNTLGSYCGLMSHWDSYNIRRGIFLEEFDFSRWGRFDEGITRFIPWQI